MPGLAELLQSQIRYSAWASQRLLESARQLSDSELNRDFQTADGSVIGTLAHIFAADRTWLGRLEGMPPADFLRDSERNLPTLQTEWPRIHEGWGGWAVAISDSSATAAFSYADLKGRYWSQPLWQVVLHVVNHGTHHRGQVAGFLRAMGHAPPQTDFTVFCRET